MTYENEIKPLLDEGYVIICDRYTTSNMLHQTAYFETEEKTVSRTLMQPHKSKSRKIASVSLNFQKGFLKIKTANRRAMILP